jgi:putative ABC transport system substrate-binding protein
MFGIRRREFIAGIGGAATWPVAARAQQPAMPVVGFLSTGSPEPVAHLVAAFRKGLSEMGYVEAHNVTIEFRWARTSGAAELAELAAELVRRRVAAIAAPISAPAALAAKASTTTIPIVFGVQADPVEAGLVATLNRPGGNVTGIASMGFEITGKRFALLHELRPMAKRFAVLVNSNFLPLAEPVIREAQAAASAIGAQMDVLTAGSNQEIDNAFASLVQKRTEALLVAQANTLFTSRRVQITTLATRHALPAIYYDRAFADVGGLMSYGATTSEQARLVGIYTGRILKGETPADLPVTRPTKFEFVINLQTSKTFGLELPPTLLAVADEVIE